MKLNKEIKRISKKPSKVKEKLDELKKKNKIHK
jgi:hypothetical protein